MVTNITIFRKFNSFLATLTKNISLQTNIYFIQDTNVKGLKFTFFVFRASFNLKDEIFLVKVTCN